MIRRLPQAVADAIAAGEVVERPASVVKELCENSLDAGAVRIEVTVDGGGTTRIAVSDDGAGIVADELAMALARHATSKIAIVGDLAEVRTLGFRGEALASIVAVADVSLTSATAGAVAARVRARGGELIDQGPAAAPPGTMVEVRDLFYNTPARLRFLRSPRSETAAAVRVVSDLALCRPDVALTCRTGGRVALRSPGGPLTDALSAVFGRAAGAELVEIDAPGEISVSGAISLPRAHRAGRDGLVLVVNGRRVHNRNLAYGIGEAYRGLIPAGRHPYGVVVITIDPAEVDVNVHPTKREVRFRSEGRVYAAVQRACWATVSGTHPLVATVAWEGPGIGSGAPSRPWVREAGAVADAADLAPGYVAVSAPVMASQSPSRSIGGTLLGPLWTPGPPAALGPMTALGQVGTRWLVAVSDEGVVLIDPHAAHEKVVYMELLERWGDGGGGGGGAHLGHAQLLLIPAIVECDPHRLETLETCTQLLHDCGFSLEPFGPGLVRCVAVPAGSERADAARLAGDILDSLGGEAGSAGELRHRLAAVTACHSAVRFGDPLAPAEQQRLLDQLAVTAGGTTCPHGRPSVLVLDEASLRRAFRRPVQ